MEQKLHGMAMSKMRKWIIGVIGGLVFIPLLPIIAALLSSGSLAGYYQDVRCACGHDSYIHIDGDSYYQYSPGHGMPEQHLFDARPRDGGWELMAVRPPDRFWSPTQEYQVAPRLRIENGDLYESWTGTNWTRHARVYNPWPIWFAQWLGK